MDEVLPEFQQQVMNAAIVGVHYTESGISIDSISINSVGNKLDIPTNIGEEAIFTIDDIRTQASLESATTLFL